MLRVMPPLLRTRFLLHSRKRIFAWRVESARQAIARTLEKSKRPYIAFSTGKDSQCVAHLVWQQASGIESVYFDADCSFPESKAVLWQTAQEHSLINWTCESLLDTFSRLGGPTAPGIEYQTMKSTVYEPIRRLLEQHELDGAFIGLRADECWGREQLRKYKGNLFYSKQHNLWECNPVLDWSYDDVWAYIVTNEIEYNRAYNRMWDMPEEDQRISYWAGETKRTHGRWAWLRRNYPELFNEFIDKFPEVGEFT